MSIQFERYKDYKKVLYSPYSLAFVLTIIIILFIPDLFSKYSVEVVEIGTIANKNELIYYDDLNNSDLSERIVSFTTVKGNHSIQIFDSEGGVFDQWNLKGEIAGEKQRFVSGDVNNDNLKEIYCFCVSNDSIFLYSFEPVEGSNFLINHRFITKISFAANNGEYSLQDMMLSDMTGDSINDLIFTISGGPGVRPRSLFLYDIKNDSLISSPFSGTVISDIILFDINADGKQELLGYNKACGNFRGGEKTPQDDYSAWIMVHKNKLSYLFKPIEFPGFHTSVQIIPYLKGGETMLLSLMNHTGSQNIAPQLMIHDAEGSLLQSYTLTDSPKMLQYLLSDDDAYYLINEQGEIFIIDDPLNLKLFHRINHRINPNPWAILDADGDGGDEMVFMTAESDKALITRSYFKDELVIELPEYESGYRTNSISLIHRGNKSPLLFIQRSANFMKYEYGYNSLYLFKYPSLLLIYLIVLLLILLIRKLQQLQMREKLHLRNQITELQLVTVNNQIDPHFMFNAFNSISGLLRKHKGEEANKYFLKFSNLIRANLTTADRISRSIEEEVIIVKNFLDIQRLRLNYSFDYEIGISPQVDPKTQIPKMSIQNFAENAAKYAFQGIKEGGLVKINVEKEKSYLLIIIEDNGIGMLKTTKQDKESTGKGISMMSEYFALLNQFNSIRIQYEITDLYTEEDKPCGTKVIVRMPVIMNFNIYKHK